eukprot:211009_1
MSRFKEQVALITGGTRGIGLAIAQRLGSEGAIVVVNSRKQKNVDEAMYELRKNGISKVYGYAAHSGSEEDMKKLVNFIVNTCKLKKIDILVCNAGTNPHFGDIMSAESSHWNKIYEVNLRGPYLLCKYALPYMPQNNKSSIIMNASVGAYSLSNGSGVYSILKLAMVGLVKVMSKSLATKGIRVNCVSPGLIRTKMAKVLCDAVDNKQIDIGTVSEMKRLGLSKEIASVVAFLASDDASYVTGENIVISGGKSPRL